MNAPQRDAAEARTLFLKALDLSPALRVALLEDPLLSPATREELRALLEADDGAETYLRQTVASEQPSGSGVGERFGTFETRELLGRGGMGAVFRADRVDGEIEQTVAVKVMERGWLAPRAFERFRQERQFLAGLVHPNIARLVDGGTRPDGIPYLVMEYVDGYQVDEYCKLRELLVADRLRLFLPLCDAVEYAHGKLIVHSDLKPSNVMVTASGEPKLLDFGVAKALDATSSRQTQTVILTPGFASPEQILGEEVTTATDVYGLGAVLYFLLTGHPPHRVEGLPAAGLQHTIARTAMTRPSVLRPELQGDLENILLKALHPEPRRRYASARDLGEDIEAYLSHRPVGATPDSWLYRTRRFVRRHTVVSVAATLALLAVAGGTAASLYEARRAQRRFAQVRDLSNRFVFDFEAAIRDTPGTLTARRMVATTAREYLASLASDAGSDPGLNRELAQSYYRLSRVEMSAGESGPSIEHLRRSIEILRNLRDDCCGPPAERARYISALTDLARYQEDSRTPEDALRLSNEALRTARAWHARSPGEPLASRALVIALSTAGNVRLSMGQAREAREVLEEALRRSDALLKQEPDDDLAYDSARTEHWLASAVGALDGPAAALGIEKNARERMDSMLARHPENVRWRNLRIMMAASTASILRRLAEKDPSLQPQSLNASREAWTLAQANAQQNPGDNDVLDTAAVMATRLANQLVRTKRIEEALPLLQQAGDIIDALVKNDPADRRNLYLQATNMAGRGGLLGNLGRWAEEVPIDQKAEELDRGVLVKWPGDLAALDVMATVLANRTSAERHLRHLDSARETCRRGLDVAADLIARNKGARNSVSDLDELREEARILGVPDRTLRSGINQ